MNLDRDEIVESLIEQWSALQTLLDSLSDADWQRPSALPGWTVHDIASHIIGTELFLLGEQPPAPVQADHVQNPIGAFNEGWVEELRSRTPQEMRALLRTTADRRGDALHALTDDEWNAPSESPVGPTTYARFMRIRLFDCWFHELDIRDAVGKPDVVGGHRAQIAFREILAALGYVIGKRAGAPTGSRIAIHLTGGLGQTINLEVADRATVVEQLSGPATTSIWMDSGLFVRLYGGRVSVDDHRSRIRFEGDAAVGEKIVDNLALNF